MSNKKEPYKPLPEYLSIGPSDIHGAGIFAKEDVPKDIETITVVNNDHGMQTLSASISYEDLVEVVAKGADIEQYVYLQEEKTNFDTVDLSLPNQYEVFDL